MINVLIADDHTLIRQGLKQVLEEIPDMAVCGEAATAGQVLDLARNADGDVLVLDLRLPDRSGYEILKDLKLEKPGLPVLVLSMYNDPELVSRVLHAGASGYISKECLAEELVSAIRRVSAGQKYVDPALAVQMVIAGLERSSPEPLHSRLSAREFEVLELISQGKTTHAIAEELSLSVKTVGTYRARVMEKMNFHSNADAIRYALENHLSD